MSERGIALIAATSAILGSITTGAEEHAATLELLVDEDVVAAETERRLADIAIGMTAWAKRLNLGAAADATEVAISLKLLNVVLRRPSGRLPLTRIRSAKNYIGYHLAAHLALHTYLRRNNRPAPGFLMLDQPTQAFFPESPATLPPSETLTEQPSPPTSNSSTTS